MGRGRETETEIDGGMETEMETGMEALTVTDTTQPDSGTTHYVVLWR
jgi:hypothetical protein